MREMGLGQRHVRRWRGLRGRGKSRGKSERSFRFLLLAMSVLDSSEEFSGTVASRLLQTHFVSPRGQSSRAGVYHYRLWCL